MTDPHSGRSPDDRPRPQYGEYATPAEQRARIREPAPVHEAPPPAPQSAAPPFTQASPRVRPGAAANRIVTIALLVYGAVSVLTSAFSFVDLGALADATYKMMGVPGSFTSTPTTQAWGIAAAVILVIGYIATAVLSVIVMRRGRVSWWIPLVGAVVTYIVVTVCLAVPLMADPAFTHYMLNR